MAVTWNLSIREIGHNSGNYSISAEVTDDQKPVGHQTENVAVSNGRMDTQAQKDKIYAELKAQYALAVSDSDKLSVLEAEAKTKLEK